MSQKTLKLELIEVNKETSDSVSLYFDSKGQIQDFYPGQFLTLLLPFENRSVRRSYSICTSPQELPRIGVCVKRVDNGLVSNLLNDKATSGQVYELIEPYGNFSLDYKQSTLPDLVLIGAGSGVTPLMSIVTTYLRHPSKGKIVFIYGNRDEENIIFGARLKELAAAYPQHLELIPVLSRAGSGWTGEKGRIGTEVLNKLLASRGLLQSSSQHYYICGPEGMMHGAVDYLLAAGIPMERIHRESFYHAPKEETTVSSSGEEGGITEVTIRFEGKEHSVMVEDGQAILEAALDAGLDLPYACQMGICGMCRCEKISGDMEIGDQESLTDAEIKAGAALVCVGHPKGSGLVLSYER